MRVSVWSGAGVLLGSVVAAALIQTGWVERRMRTPGPGPERPATDRLASEHPSSNRPASDRPAPSQAARPATGRPASDAATLDRLERHAGEEAASRHWDEALRAYDALLPQRDTANLRVARAGVLLSLGRLPAALIDLDAALRRDPDRQDALRLRAQVNAGRQDWRGALDDAGRALDGNPGDAILQVVRGQALLGLNRPDEAGAAFDAALAVQPGNVAAITGRAAVLEARGDIVGAVAALSAAIAGRPEPGLLLARARLQEARGDFASAAADLRVVLADDPRRAEVRDRLVDDLVRADDYGRASATLDEALTAEPRSPHWLRRRAELRKGKGDFEGAAADYTQLMALAPQDIDLYNLRGYVLARLGRFDNAIADFGRVLAVDGQNPVAFNNRAWSFMMKGDLEFAVRDCSMSLKFRPDVVAALDTCSVASLRAERWQDAQGYTEDWLKVQPSAPGALFLRARAKDGLGDRAGAHRDQTAALAQDPAVADRYPLLRARPPSGQAPQPTRRVSQP